METIKLVPMTRFILDVNLMHTDDFCNKYNVPLPNISNGVIDFLRIDVNKQKMFVNYAKFLDADVSEEMFTGENPVFPGFVKCTPAEAERKDIPMSFDNFSKNDFMMRIFQKNYNAGDKVYDTYVTYFRIKKVEQLTGMGLLVRFDVLI